MAFTLDAGVNYYANIITVLWLTMLFMKTKGVYSFIYAAGENFWALIEIYHHSYSILQNYRKKSCILKEIGK